MGIFGVKRHVTRPKSSFSQLAAGNAHSADKKSSEQITGLHGRPGFRLAVALKNLARPKTQTLSNLSKITV